MGTPRTDLERSGKGLGGYTKLDLKAPDLLGWGEGAPGNAWGGGDRGHGQHIKKIPNPNFHHFSRFLKILALLGGIFPVEKKPSHKKARKATPDRVSQSVSSKKSATRVALQKDNGITMLNLGGRDSVRTSSQVGGWATDPQGGPASGVSEWGPSEKCPKTAKIDAKWGF